MASVASFDKAGTSVLRLLKYRSRSEQEIQDKLNLKGFPPEVIKETIQYFKDLKLIDDHLFAEQWIRARLAKPLGFKRIAFELKVKGISDRIIKTKIENAGRNFQETAVVTTLVQKQAEKHKHIDPQKKKQRIYYYLLRRGFAEESIAKALKEL